LEITEKNYVLGVSSKETVKLDLDNTSFRLVKKWALETMMWFGLLGFIILKSSPNHYHVVFDKRVSWSRNMKTVGWVSLMSRNKGLLEWLRMQCIKESSTLRISPKGNKKSPRIVFRYGSQNHEIKEFLKYRKLAMKWF
jgi:hypothetical protein